MAAKGGRYSAPLSALTATLTYDPGTLTYEPAVF